MTMVDDGAGWFMMSNSCWLIMVDVVDDGSEFMMVLVVDDCDGCCQTNNNQTHRHTYEIPTF